MSRPRTCQRCARKPVLKKTVTYCFDCHPAGPLTPPACRRCGSSDNYYSAGLCSGCHQYAPQPVDSCRDCHAWGATRHTAWLCRACVSWRVLHPDSTGDCTICSSRRTLGRGPFCRLCWRTAATFHTAHRHIGRTYQPLDVASANRHGQQLFLADIRPTPRRPATARAAAVVWATVPGLSSVRQHRQLLLFDNNPPSWANRHGIPPPHSPHLAAELDQLARTLGADRGWSATSIGRVRLGIAALLGRHTDRERPIRASELVSLQSMGLHSTTLMKAVLVEAGLFHDDRTPAIDSWFSRTIIGLPPQMTDEVTTWFTCLRQGSSTVPRMRPRHQTTIRIRVRHVVPVLRVWSDAGHQSLRDITSDDVRTVLAPSGNDRVLTGASLRSLFGVLKARRLIFTNPTARVRTGTAESRQPLPADLARLRAALQSTDPTTAALAALLAFHGIRPGQLRRLQLTDIRDGRLHLDDRSVPLAEPVRDRVAAYLDERARRWPQTANSHLFVHLRTATTTGPVGGRWLTLQLGMPARAIRDDRILDEAHATDGDVRRLCDLFGIAVKTAGRYARTVDHPDLRT